MIVPIALCMFLGVWLGERLGISWLALPLFFVGALAGFTSNFKLMKRFLKDKDNQGRRDAKKN